MKLDFVCGSEQAQAALAAYLYGECDAADRAALEAHLAVCAACSAELAALGATRSALAAWTPPETELGFRIVSNREADRATTPVIAASQPATVLRPARWWQRPLPAWAQVAAAIVIFAAGGLLGMRAGGAETPGTASVVASDSSAERPAVSTVSAQDLEALEQRLRREMTLLRASVATPPAATPVRASASDDQLIARVRALLAESEERQQQELALRIRQVLSDVDVQRRVDLARIEETFGQMQGITGLELRDQREAIQILRQVSFPVRRPQ